MNNQTAKLLRRFAELRTKDYNWIKKRFLSRSKKQQLIDIQLIGEEVRRHKIMAEQKICDRSHKIVIPAGTNFYTLTFRTPEGEQIIDLCEQCGADFKAFMNAPAQPGPAVPEAPVNPGGQPEIPPANPGEQQPAA